MHHNDIDSLTRLFAERWKRFSTRRRYASYWHEHQAGHRVVTIALSGPDITGYINILWRSQYAPFREAGIAEINDLVVAERFRRQGIGLALMREAERQVQASGRSVVGLGCGTTAYYAAARRLYANLGYVPDGCGEQNTPWGRIIYMTKPLA